MSLTYIKPERVFLRGHPELTEKWLQDRIAEDPSLLGLGELVLKDKERIHPKGGRLDLLLQSMDSNRRYEVEIQLGATDESHVVRTIEYWDIERKRYLQYEHTAVIVAENITGRFLNVISLFNGFIPLVALQLSAVQVNNQVALVFTKVLDELQLGLVDEDEEVQEVTDRSYWEGGVCCRLLRSLLFRSFTAAIGGGSHAWITGSSDYVAGPSCRIDLLRMGGPLSQHRRGIPTV